MKNSECGRVYTGGLFFILTSLFTIHLLPARALAIEVVGGVHTLTAERDAARLAALRAQGLTVITLTNEQVYAGAAERLLPSLLEVRHAA